MDVYLPEFRADYDERFGLVPRSPHDAHRPVRDGEDLGRTFTRRGERKLSRNLTLHYKRMIYLVEPGPETLRLAGEACHVHVRGRPHRDLPRGAASPLAGLLR